jgi:hypothetical protein
MDAPDPLRALCESLEALADVYEGVCAAIDAKDSASARALIERSKALHAAVNEANAVLRAAPPVSPSADIMGRIRGATARVQAGSRVVQAWLAAEPAITTSPREAVRRGLPEKWDFEVDVLLLVGRGAGALARQVLALGQKRLFAYVPVDASVDDLPPEVVTARTLDELSEAVLRLPGRAPNQSLWWRVPDPLITDELYEAVGGAFGRATVKLAVNKKTVNAMGELWLLQGTANLPDVASWPSIDALRQAFRGKPCIIASPGPSLDKNLHLVPAIRDRVLLMTSSHALAALSRAGVVPDVCLALDPQDLRYHFDGCPVEQVTMVLAATAHPDLFALPARRIVTFGGNSELDEWVYRGLGENALLSAGGSVACAALAMAAEWGCDPIMLIGQDLAFSGGKYYSSLSVDAELKVEVSADGQQFGLADLGKGMANLVEKANRSLAPEKLVEARGYYGGTVQTSGSFDGFRRWMTTFVEAEQRGLRFLNCTEGGAYIDGMEHVSLATAIERHAREPMSVESLLESALAAVDGSARKSAMLARMTEMHRGLEECDRLAGDCVKLARMAARSPSRLDALKPLERRLLKALKPVVFVSLLRQKAILDALERGRRAKSLTESLEASLELYEVVRSACAALRPLLSAGIARLETEPARVART